MHAQIFTYTVQLPNEEAYLTQFADPVAAKIAGVKGLVSKVWMADFDKKFASFYIWETKEDMEAFMSSELIAKLRTLDFVSDLKIEDYPIVEKPSKVTRGIL